MEELKPIKQIIREDGVIFMVDDFVRHFKGNIYRIKSFARDSETLELYVIYRDVNRSLIWSRKVDDFLSKKGDIWRFEHI